MSTSIRPTRSHLPIPALKSILCPVDFSPPSGHALDSALRLARRSEATITLIHVTTPLTTLATSQAGMAAVAAEGHKTNRQAVRSMKPLLSRCEGAGINARTTRVTGDVRSELLNAVDDFAADIVVMGTHGRSSVERFLVGSVTEGMVRRSTVPVLAVPAGRKPGPVPRVGPRALVTTDFTAGIGKALDQAVGFLGDAGGEVRLLHVVPHPEHARDALSAVTIVLDEYAKRMDKGRGRTRFVPEVEVGTAHELIARAADRLTPDVIVIRVRRRSPIERLFGEATAIKVLRQVPYAVLAVPEELQD